MIDLESIRSCSDQTFDYKAIIKKPMTVGEFIKEWMTTSPNEWGYFGIYDGKTIFGNPQCEYSNGKITTDPIPDEYLNAEIDEVNGNGGWSRFDFIFKIRRKPMDDLISRQAAIEAIQNLYPDMPKIDVFGSLNRWREKNKQYIECEYVINILPSAIRKKGKWMDTGDYCVCNQCWHTEQQFNGVERIPRHTPFCAICGADMREEKTDAI